jgi:hypothetical protein
LRKATRATVSAKVAYSAARKGGMQQWFPRFRAVLLEDHHEVAEVSSLRRAEQIANLLNAASAGKLPARKETDASYAHYKATAGPHGERVVLRAEWRGEVEEVLRSDDAELVEQVAALLERVDPAKRVRVQGSGVRWW